MHPEFPLAPEIIYLNHAAVSPWPLRTCAAVQQFANENSRLGATHYPRWMAREQTLRQQLQTLLNAPSADHIALVKNTSEAISFVATGLDWHAGDNIVTSAEEFPSNRLPWEALQERGVVLREADLMAAASPEQALFDQVDQRTRLIAISSVQYASGLRMDLGRIGHFCRGHGILFLVDAIQSLGALSLDVQACQADFVMADGHKWLLAPEGLGVFYLSSTGLQRLKPTEYGWHMTTRPGDYDNRQWEVSRSARRFECGSPNMLGIHALSASLSLVLDTGPDVIEQAILARTARIIECIQASDTLECLSLREPERRSGITVFRHRRVANEALWRYLKSNGVVCAQRGGGIRYAPHFYTPMEHLQHAVTLAANAPLTS